MSKTVDQASVVYVEHDLEGFRHTEFAVYY